MSAAFPQFYTEQYPGLSYRSLLFEHLLDFGPEGEFVDLAVREEREEIADKELLGHLESVRSISGHVSPSPFIVCCPA